MPASSSTARARLARPARAGRRLDPLDRDPARGLRGERLEARDDLVVVRRVRPLRGDDAVGVPREEEAPERRVVALPGARPPDGRLVHRARERDVEETEVLAALLAVAEPAVPGDVGAVLAADVDRPDVVVLVVVVGGRLVLVDVAGLPGERVVDDRELEALAAMDGQHLDRLGVGVEPQGAILVGAVPVGVGDPLPQPGGQRGNAELLLGRGGVQQLADVAEVGQPALAAQPCEDPPGDRLGRRDRVEQRGDAAAAEEAGPAVELRVQLLPGRLVGGGHLLRAPAEEGGERGRPGAGGRDRPLDRLEQPQPLVRGGSREDAAGAVDDGRDAGALERVVHERGQLVRGDEHRDVARPDRLPRAVGAVGGAGDQGRGR